MIKKIKEKLANIQLNKQLANQVRQKDFVNIEDARNVGIVFEATNLEEFELIKKYVQKLKEQGKKVQAIGYFDQKFTPVNISYPKTEFDLFNNKELKGMNQPASPYIQTFVSEVRDLLIDFNLHNKFPLRYIAANSYAKCKVGIDIPANQKLHDVLISIHPSDGVELFIKQLNTYLSLINKKK